MPSISPLIFLPLSGFAQGAGACMFAWLRGNQPGERSFFLVVLLALLFVGLLVYTGVRAGRWMRGDMLSRQARASQRANPPPSPVALQAQRIRQELLVLMAGARPYRNPDLRVPDLAEAMGVSPHLLSAVINREFAMNFSDFVNRYRIHEAEQLLLDPERRQYTILSVAMEVGFASKVSFNRAFKKHTGVTPSEYQRGGGTSARRSR